MTTNTPTSATTRLDSLLETSKVHTMLVRLVLACCYNLIAIIKFDLLLAAGALNPLLRSSTGFALLRLSVLFKERC